MNHPNLSKEINTAMTASEMLGGVWFERPRWAKAVEGESLSAGTHVDAVTENSAYCIEKRADGTYIKGNPEFCPEFTKCSIHGSTFGGSMIKVGYIGVGMFLEFSIGGKTITTSQIQNVVAVNA